MRLPDCGGSQLRVAGLLKDSPARNTTGDIWVSEQNGNANFWTFRSTSRNTRFIRSASPGGLFTVSIFPMGARHTQSKSNRKPYQPPTQSCADPGPGAGGRRSRDAGWGPRRLHGKQKQLHIGNAGEAVARCRRSVYCTGQAGEEFPACHAKGRARGTFSEVCARKPADLLCIHTLYTSARYPWQKSLQILPSVKRGLKKESRKENIPPKAKESE